VTQPNQPGSSSLTLRALLKDATAGIGLNARPKEITGLTPVAKTLVVSAMASNAPVLVVVPSDREIDVIVEDTRFFLGALGGFANRDAETVLPLPSHEVDPYRGLQPHFEIASARARALLALLQGSTRVVVASVAGLFPRVSPPGELREASLQLRDGVEIAPAALAHLLVSAGFTREDPVDQHGEFAIRGGVADIFPAGEVYPYRIEFVGDTVESIRRFDPATQRSIDTVNQATIVPLRDRISRDAGGVEDVPAASIVDYLRQAGALQVVVFEADLSREAGERFEATLRDSYEAAQARDQAALPPSRLCATWSELLPVIEGATRLEQLDVGDGTVSSARKHVSCQPVTPVRGRIADWIADIQRLRDQDHTVLAIVGTPGMSERTIELLHEYGARGVAVEGAEMQRGAGVLVGLGQLSQGFRLPDARLVIYAETDIFDEERHVHERHKSITRTFLADFRDLKVGDHVVHVDHGIGMFVGLKKLAVGTSDHEFMELKYADDHKLFVPMDRLDLVQKYTGGAKPSLDRLGGTTWEKAKTRVKKAMRDMAGELLKLYAARKAMTGFAFGPDTHWQEEFESTFEHELTPDQAAAVADIRRDMESPTPMDRLLCGDVGYGKTEVAMRAAFKAVMAGKQVAVLTPTTVLAFQHLKTFKNRFAAFPVTVDMVSRFRTKLEQKQVLSDLEAGKVDIIIGTHRLLSKDVVFRDLGLLVVDEEQRFGVAHKERIKQIRRRVDALALSATPIPRTLNMALVGIRDMSVIETAPRDRLSIQTNVVKFDQQVISRAIQQELERGGQVYFVHNRVESIYSMGNLLTRLVPNATVGIGHGQMDDESLERVMVDFVARRFDVLLATTIIENGLDIPNANTMIINRADRYGLAQLYQLRGRVGRSDRRAYAYLLVPPATTLSPVARRRLAAISEFSDLGSGFRIAALDLEIRGAGNLLGGEQSGHIEAVGFEMYTKLLEETIRELKGEELEDELHADVKLGVDLKIEEGYVPDMNQRLGVYRKIAGARGETELEDMGKELRDRYGPTPASVLSLIEYARIRVRADHLRLEAIDRDRTTVVFKFRQQSKLDPLRFITIVRSRADLTLLTPLSVAMDLRVGAGLKTTSRPSAPPPAPIAPPGRPVAAGRRAPQPGPRPPTPTGSQASWWTSRAKTGAVEPGFNKAELTKSTAEDPRAPGGLFERVLGLLNDLAGA
jgi:transcription-repair coupling factor (superfamily II helicase)